MANTTRYINFSGKAKWIRVVQPNKFDKWSLDLYLKREDIDRYRELKTKNRIKKDEEGEYITMSRPVKMKRLGKEVALLPPTVTDKDGTPMPNANIGNGSEITVTLEYYPYSPPGKTEKEYACRLLAVRVDNLIPYATDSYTETELRATAELKKTPPPPTWN
jgi:hypothetical protein